MNVFQLVIKQMRQRALSTWLTLLSVMLGVALAVSVTLISRESDKIFGQSDYGYDVIVGAKGSQLGLVLNTVYQLGQSPGNIPYSVYESLRGDLRSQIRWAVPVAVGDQWEGHRIIATTPAMFGLDDQGQPQPVDQTYEYRMDRRYTLSQGRVFRARTFEAVIGADVAETAGLRIGSTFQAEHGAPTGGSFKDVHGEEWEVVGILDHTGTASDQVIFIPLESFYAIGEHEEALTQIAGLSPPEDDHAAENAEPDAAHDDAHDHETEHADEHAHDDHAHDEPAPAHDEHAHDEPTHGADGEEGHDHDHQAFVLDDQGRIELALPKEKWKLSAIFVRAAGGPDAASLMWRINNQPDAMAVNPAMQMREFFDTFLAGGRALLLMVALLVTIVAAVSILVSIYNSVSARKREVAILRALGATRVKILSLICLEAGLVGLFGGILGLIVGHLIGAGGSLYLEQLMGERINWLAIGSMEGIYLVVVVALAVLAGLVPALKAYGTPVATNLVSS